uniref:PiggyBac transposable element-derived protein domain-containing protein n=1 Tax=Neogobius melanostomus TaxID=47308 RepID=A0A8C6UI16_9GOBI
HCLHLLPPIAGRIVMRPVLNKMASWTVLQLFQLFFSNATVKTIIDNTNTHAERRREAGKKYSWTILTKKEFYIFLAIVIYTGLVGVKARPDLWRTDFPYNFRFPRSKMTRARFEAITWTLHLSDPEEDEENERKKGTPDYDRLFKIKPLYTEIVTACKSFYQPQKTLASMRKSNLRCYMPGKPHKWGFKMWGRAGQSGYLYDFDVCQGRENPDKEKSDVGATGDVVLKMTSTLPAGKNHKVFADNFFTSVPLVEHLKQRGIYYIGTVRMNRVKNCRLIDEKELKTKGRGSLDFRVNQEDNIIVRWYDNKAVNLLSSFVGVEPLGNVKRWDRKAKTYIMVPRPAIVDTYNRFMGGVDLLDMLSALYKFNFRSRRWYIYIWWHTVTVAVINAWLRYRRDMEKLQPRQKALPLRRFQASVGSALTSAGKLPPDVRKDGLYHFPTWETRQRCKHCVGHFAHVYCEKCRVHLCLNKDRNCFQAYHNSK